MNVPITAEEVAKRNLIFLRAKLSDSSDDDTPAPSAPVDLLPSDLTFLTSLSPASFSVDKTLSQFTSLLQDKFELIVLRQDAQIALEFALKSFLKAYWKVLMETPRLANPINDVFKAVLYYKDRKDMTWVHALCEKLDLPRRMDMVGWLLDAISELHQIEIDKRRTEEKRQKQKKKMSEKMVRQTAMQLRKQEVRQEVVIPEVRMEDVFGPDVDIDSEMHT